MDGQQSAVLGAFFDRRTPVHLSTVERDFRSIIQFVTVCSKDRKCIFNTESVHQLIVRSWQQADGWLVGRYVIMPDHIHLFAAPRGVEHVSLKKWVGYWKSVISRSWPDRSQQPIWHPDFWDRQLRTGESYNAKWQYVRNNPVRHGLAKDAEEWKYQGELNALTWSE